jgi:ribonuclease R
VQVILDRIDRQQRRLQFALLPGTEPKAATSSLRTPKKKKFAEEAAAKAPLSPKRSGKKKTRLRNKKSKGKR